MIEGEGKYRGKKGEAGKGKWEMKSDMEAMERNRRTRKSGKRNGE